MTASRNGTSSVSGCLASGICETLTIDAGLTQMVSHFAGICCSLAVILVGDVAKSVEYAGNGSDLQSVIDTVAQGTTVQCDVNRRVELFSPIIIRKAITLKGLNAALPRGLGNTSLVVVEAAGVTIFDCE